MATDRPPRGSDGSSTAGPLPAAPPEREEPLITAVEIENFKGIGHPVRIDLRPITLLFGPNSAGKSTVLHALCYAHEVLSGGTVDARETRLGGDQIDLGGFHRFAHAYLREREVRLRFELNLHGRSIPYLVDSDEALTLRPVNREALSGLRTGWLVLTVAWSDERMGPIVRDCEVGVAGKVVGRITRVDGAKADLRVNSRHPFAEYSKALLAGCARLVRDELSELRYVGPLRNLHPQIGRRRSNAARGRWADGSAAWDLLNDHARRSGCDEVVRSVSDWLSREDRLATGYALRVEEVHSPARPEDELVGWLNYEHGVLGNLKRSERLLAEAPRGTTLDSPDAQNGDVPNSTAYQLDLRTGVLTAGAVGPNELRVVELVNTWVRLPVRTSDVGTGISQILPVVVAALDPERPSITAIEQPELHVHPRLQVELGDLFAQGVDQGGAFLIETHSEHLMLRLLRRIEETGSDELPEGKPALKPDQVSVVYVEQVEGEVRATRLRIDETGEFIDRWPHGFFDERTDELF